MTALSVEERNELAETLADSTVPWLTYAVHTRDEQAVADLLGGLDRQQLLGLAVVLASRCPRPLMPGDAIAPGKAHPLITLLAAERVHRGVPVPALARRMGYEARTLYDWEAGRKAPSLERLEDYANALGYQLALQAAPPPSIAPEEAAQHRIAVAAALGITDTTTTGQDNA